MISNSIGEPQVTLSPGETLTVGVSALIAVDGDYLLTEESTRLSWRCKGSVPPSSSRLRPTSRRRVAEMASRALPPEALERSTCSWRTAHRSPD